MCAQRISSGFIYLKKKKRIKCKNYFKNIFLYFSKCIARSTKLKSRATNVTLIREDIFIAEELKCYQFLQDSRFLIFFIIFIFLIFLILIEICTYASCLKILGSFIFNCAEVNPFLGRGQQILCIFQFPYQIFFSIFRIYISYVF